MVAGPTPAPLGLTRPRRSSAPFKRTRVGGSVTVCNGERVDCRHLAIAVRKLVEEAVLADGGRMRRPAYGDVHGNHVVRNEADDTAGRADAWSVRIDADQRSPASFEMRCAPSSSSSCLPGEADPAVRRRPGVEVRGSRTHAGQEKSGPVAHGFALTSEMTAMPLGTVRRLQSEGELLRKNVRLYPWTGKNTHLVDRWNRLRPVRRFCRGAVVKRRGRRSSSGFPRCAGVGRAAADYQSRAQRESQERNDPPRGRAHRGNQPIPDAAGVAEAQLGRPAGAGVCGRDGEGLGGEREGGRTDSRTSRKPRR
jgi:hypothetical protein